MRSGNRSRLLAGRTFSYGYSENIPFPKSSKAWASSYRLKGATERQPSLDPLIALAAKDMAKVNEAILARAQSHVELIPELAGHLINSGGKRIRPMLTVATARMCGYKGDAHVKLATAVEFMHTATLLHDDVVDESDLRRGKKTARLIWGNQASVLVGDYLLGQAFKMMVETGSLEALRMLANAAAVIAEGEVLQLVGLARHIDHRGRLSAGDRRQDGGAVLGRGRSRRDHRRRARRTSRRRSNPTAAISASPSSSSTTRSIIPASRR